MTDCVMVRTTVASEADAIRMGDAVVDARLAACVQTMPVESTYRWQGRVERSAEFLLLMKTRRALVDALMTFVREQHAYDVPELVVTAIEAGSADYLSWIRQETQG
ncbi:MAG: divalent-cation tolerance protein CutA [Verrucomicrobia bacterium]|jgi:periplasmic divalent cation tolerance protein|nr:divalent-cation tolerance protein CutA [Verrucomicrobiota bacterium]